MDNPKTLLFDFETTNFKTPFGRILCAVFMDVTNGNRITIFREDDKRYRSRRADDDRKMVLDIRDFMFDAWEWMGYYSKLFDYSFLCGRLALAGEWPLEKRRHCDLYYYTGNNTIRLGSRSLKGLSERFRFKTEKTPVLPEYWLTAETNRYNRKSKADYKNSMDQIVDHCVRDVEMLREAWIHLYPFVQNVHR